MPQKKNDLLTLLFFIVGLLAVVDLLFVSVRQRENEQIGTDRLLCVESVIEAMQNRLPLPECQITWDAETQK